MSILFYIVVGIGYVLIGGIFWAFGKRLYKWNEWGTEPDETIAPIFWPISVLIIILGPLIKKSSLVGDWLARKVIGDEEKSKSKLEITSKNYHEIKSLIAEYEKNLPVMERAE